MSFSILVFVVVVSYSAKRLIAMIGCNQVLMVQIVINLNVKYGVKPCRGKNYAYDVDQDG